MSLMGDVQKFIESHPGCTSSDIANAFADFPRKSVLQSTSKLRQCGRVAHRFEGKTRRHFALETDIQPGQEPDIGTKPVRSCYVGTNDPPMITRWYKIGLKCWSQSAGPHSVIHPIAALSTTRSRRSPA